MATEMTPAERFGVFLALSRVLTGDPGLDPVAGRRHVGRVLNHPLGGGLGALLQRFRDIQAAGGDLVQGVKAGMMGDPAMAPLAKVVTLVWFTGALKDPDGTWILSGPDDYFGALIWGAIGAHPPAMSNGYFGHWKYPVET